MDMIMNPHLMEIGLVEMKETINSTVWFDCYLIDIEMEPVNDVKTFISTVVMATSDESATTVLSKQANVKRLPLDLIRLKPKTMESVSLVVNNNVEVMIIDENKYIAWKLAQIKKVKDDNILVQYFDNDGQLVELNELDIINVSEIRHTNSCITLNEKLASQFVRCELPVSKIEFEDDPFWLSDVNFHFNLKKVLNLINIHYNNEKKSLICFGMAKDETDYSKKMFIDRCYMMSMFHFRAVKELFSLKKHCCMPITINAKDNCVIQFPISRDLIGLAIGKGGVNIIKARNIEGIKSVELFGETNTFIIRGISMDSCKRAAELLNFKKEEIKIAGYREFFSNKLYMHELVAKSKIVQFDVQRPDSDEHLIDGKLLIYKLTIIGTEESINNFKLLFNYQLSEYGRIKQLKESNPNLARLSNNRIKNLELKNYSKQLPLKFSDAVKS